MTINRREFIIAAGTVFAVPIIKSFAADPSKKPTNVLIIYTDEHNFRTLGCYRKTLSPEQAFMWGKQSIVTTPNIDWIAQNGAICTKFYATSPVCSPSRAAFISGKYPQNTAVITNDIKMRDDTISFAEILRRIGYKTGYSGKWHLNGVGRPQWAPKHKFGFDDNRYMFNTGHWKKLKDTPNGPKIDTGDKLSYSANCATKDNFTTDWLTNKTIKFIKKNNNRPFCYMMSIPDPHGPDTVRKPYDTLYKHMIFEKPRTYDKLAKYAPSWAKPQPKKSYNQSGYYGMIKCIDYNVGRILKHLQATKLIENTIVIFSSDHGDLRGEHHRHNKGLPLEASAKIPLLIYYPQKIKAGTIVTQAIGAVDFLPTLLGLMNVATAGKEEGTDASALFQNNKSNKNVKDIAFIRSAGYPHTNWIAAFTSRYKLVLSPKDEPWLLDLKLDPDELYNFLADPAYKKIAQNLANEILNYGRKFNDKHIYEDKVAVDLEKLGKKHKI